MQEKEVSSIPQVVVAVCHNTESTANLAALQILKAAVVFSSVLTSRAVSELAWLRRGVSLLDLYIGKNKPSHPTPTTFGGIVTAPCAPLRNLPVTESNSSSKRTRQIGFSSASPHDISN